MRILPYCTTEGEGRMVCAQKGCEDCLRELLKENAGLIWAVISRQGKGAAEYGDLWQEGRIGFWQAVKDFDPGLGNRFSTFAWQIIQRRIWWVVKRVSKKQGYLEEEEWGDIGGRVAEEWQARQTRAALEGSLVNLPERQRQAIEKHTGWNGEEPQTYVKIGQEWGVSRQRAQQIYAEGILLLRVPGISLRLRSLCERCSREDYREALRQNRERQRRMRRRQK